jgi:hypothetical protein
MKTPKKPKPSRALLEARLRDLEAQLASTYHFADAYLGKVEHPKLLASGVLVRLDFLGGKEAVTPFVVRGGLSPDTVAALRQDIARSYAEAVEFKPSGVTP